MSGPGYALLLCVVIIAGTVGGGATRYERCGPPAERAVAGAIALLAWCTALLLSLGLFAITALHTAGTAWRILGVACALGALGALIAARFVDHTLALRSWRSAWHALIMDVPWRRLADGISTGARVTRDRVRQSRSSS